MECMMAKKKTLSQLCEGLTLYPQVLKNIRVTDKAAAQQDPDVQKAVAAAVAALGESGRILVRESGTEPLIRVMVEAESGEICEQHVDHVIAVIRGKGHAV
jgi:phosphoglucosamine mutase